MTNDTARVFQLEKYSVEDFVTYLKAEGISDFFFYYDKETGKVIPSHSQLQPIADLFQNDKRDFLEHEGLFFKITEKYDTLLGAFIHKTVRGQAAGGTRYWDYPTIEAYFRDGLRLSKGMTRKNALAGLWWGGGKGVIARNKNIDRNDKAIRHYIYHEFGKLITAIKGAYVTAEDVGTTVTDMASIFSGTRFTTCIPHEVGGSGNPSQPTALGVVMGMEAALAFSGKGDLTGKTIAVQGLGNVATFMIEYLFERGVARVVAVDISAERVAAAREKFKEKNIEVSQVEPDDLSILTTDCDVLAPCAVGGILNPRTIPTIQAPIVCGAANNQLEDTDRDDRLIFEKGILYVPDFLVNRMGIVNCANEQYGYVNDDPFINQHLSKDWEYSVYQTTQRVLRQSAGKKEPTAKIAVQLADELALVPHPIFGHRGEQIIRSLVENK